MRNRSKGVRKDSRTIPLPGNAERGDGEDHGKWYRCWNCGFVCNVDRDALGGPDDTDGVTPEAYTTLDQYGDTAYHCEGAAGKTQTICEAAGGTWSSTRYIPRIDSGCPMCGCLNWRGDF